MPEQVMQNTSAIISFKSTCEKRPRTYHGCCFEKRGQARPSGSIARLCRSPGCCPTKDPPLGRNLRTLKKKEIKQGREPKTLAQHASGASGPTQKFINIFRRYQFRTKHTPNTKLQVRFCFPFPKSLFSNIGRPFQSACSAY